MTTLNIQNMTTKTLTALAISSFAFGANASIEPQQCENVRFADVAGLTLPQQPPLLLNY